VPGDLHKSENSGFKKTLCESHFASD